MIKSMKILFVAATVVAAAGGSLSGGYADVPQDKAGKVETAQWYVPFLGIIGGGGKKDILKGERLSRIA